MASDAGAGPRRAPINPRAAELRYAGLFGGMFLALGVQMAFLQLWYQDWGLTPAEIGLINSLGIAVRIGAGIAIPAFVDRLARPERAIAGLALAGALAAALHLAAAGRTEIYALTMLAAAAYAALIPLSDAHGYAAAAEHGFSYRRARSVGSFAFLAATFLGGVAIEAFGSSVAPIWIALALGLAALAGWAAPVPRREGAAAAFLPGLAAFLKSRVFLIFLLSVAAIQSSHAVYYVYSSIHWRSLGWSDTLIGALWAWGVLAEIVLFFLGRSVMARLGVVRALVLAGALAALRWTAMAFDPGLGVVAALQVLHAGSFALTHLAALAFIAEAVAPRSAGAGQGILTAGAGGVGMLLATMLAAWAYSLYGGGAYLVAAALGALGAIAALGLSAVWPGGLAVRPAAGAGAGAGAAAGASSSSRMRTAAPSGSSN